MCKCVCSLAPLCENVVLQDSHTPGSGVSSYGSHMTNHDGVTVFYSVMCIFKAHGTLGAFVFIMDYTLWRILNRKFSVDHEIEWEEHM